MKIILKTSQPKVRTHFTRASTIYRHRCYIGSNVYDYSKFRTILLNSKHFSACKFSKSWDMNI